MPARPHFLEQENPSCSSLSQAKSVAGAEFDFRDRPLKYTSSFQTLGCKRITQHAAGWIPGPRPKDCVSRPQVCPGNLLLS